jgi:ferredoxin-NADP reductase
MQQKNKGKKFILVKKINEAENITSLFLKSTDNVSYPFIAGQYVNITIPFIKGHAKSYTISNSPKKSLLAITIKRKGFFSSTLVDLKIGQKLILEGPFGYFYPENGGNDLVFIAGGIGITPFFSIISDRVGLKQKNKIYLFYSNKALGGTAFFDNLNRLTKDDHIHKVIYFLTQKKTKSPLINESKRIDKLALKKYLNNFTRKNFYICGSIKFVDDIWKMLKACRVAEKNIFTEAFF